MNAPVFHSFLYPKKRPSKAGWVQGSPSRRACQENFLACGYRMRRWLSYAAQCPTTFRNLLVLPWCPKRCPEQRPSWVLPLSHLMSLFSLLLLLVSGSNTQLTYSHTNTKLNAHKWYENHYKQSDLVWFRNRMSVATEQMICQESCMYTTIVVGAARMDVYPSSSMILYSWAKIWFRRGSGAMVTWMPTTTQGFFAKCLSKFGGMEMCKTRSDMEDPRFHYAWRLRCRRVCNRCLFGSLWGVGYRDRCG